MVEYSYSHIPETVTVPTAKLIEQLKIIDQANLLDRRVYAEAEARIAMRNAVAAPIRMVLGVEAPLPELSQEALRKVGITSRPRGPKKTHKYIALEQLSRRDKPLKVVQIIQGAFDLYRKEIERTSLSPLLAKMLKAGLLEHDSSTACWRITDAGRAELQRLEARQ